MSKSKTVPVTVHVLDKEYRIACPVEEEEALIKAARFLNERMTQVRDGGGIIGNDRIAVMAAINITHELLKSKKSADQAEADQFSDRLRLLQGKVEAALNEGRQIEL